MQEGDFPITRRDFGLFNMKFAPFVQVAEQAAAKLHPSGEMTLDFYQSILFGVNPDPACHRMKDGSLVGGGMEIGVWLEENFRKFALTLSVACGYCVRQHLEQTFGL